MKIPAIRTISMLKNCVIPSDTPCWLNIKVIADTVEVLVISEPRHFFVISVVGYTTQSVSYAPYAVNAPVDTVLDFSTILFF